ncbi:MAG: anti-sigma factor family protein [Rhodomicrobium sp.]
MNAVPCPCPERELLLHGLADGELDAANALAMEDHMRNCEGCAAAYGEILGGKAALRHEGLRLRAPPSLRERVQDAIAAEHGSGEEAALAKPAGALGNVGQRMPWRPYFGYAGGAISALALAASLVLFVSSWNPAPNIDSQLAAAHVRSLLVAHLTDVTSSDQHTVKPWFLGKLDFAPPVADLAQKDFPLIGGRLDYIGGRVVPALVYKRHGHVINLFVWPAGKMHAAPETLDGYNILTWTQGGFDHAAVSDLNTAELREFRGALIESNPQK